MNVVICLFFTLVLVDCWPSSSATRTGLAAGGDTTAFPCSQHQHSPKHDRICSWSLRRAPEARWCYVQWLSGLLGEGSWAMLTKDGKEAMREPAYVFLNGCLWAGRRWHGLSGWVMEHVLRSPSGRAAHYVKQCSFKSAVALLLCALAFICWNASSSRCSSHFGNGM